MFKVNKIYFISELFLCSYNIILRSVYMANFSDFVKEKKINEEKMPYSNEDLESMINKYSELSEDRLLSEFLKLTLEKRKRGELSEKELQNLRSTLVPVLNTQQIESLDKILEMVKNVK